jgi:hypothetical protein
MIMAQKSMPVSPSLKHINKDAAFCDVSDPLALATCCCRLLHGLDGMAKEAEPGHNVAPGVDRFISTHIPGEPGLLLE